MTGMDGRRIVAMGGGGFSMEPDNPLLDDHVLSLARTLHPAVCFVPTASGDDQGYVARFYRAFAPRATADPPICSCFSGRSATSSRSCSPRT